MKKIIAGVLILGATNLMAITNQQMIDSGTKMQEDIFQKYFKVNTNSKMKKDVNVLSAMYSEILSKMYQQNRSLYETEFSKAQGKRRSLFREMYAYYTDYVDEYSKFSKDSLAILLQDQGDFQAYYYTNTYMLLETFNLNMNTYLEALKDRKTLDENIKTVNNYLYHRGDSKTLEDYEKMSSQEMKAIVDAEYVKLNNKIDGELSKKTSVGVKQRQGNSIKSSLKRLEKMYDKYDEKFSEYIDGTSLSSQEKEKIKKLVKFETISNLKFMTESLGK